MTVRNRVRHRPIYLGGLGYQAQMLTILVCGKSWNIINLLGRRERALYRTQVLVYFEKS